MIKSRAGKYRRIQARSGWSLVFLLTLMVTNGINNALAGMDKWSANLEGFSPYPVASVVTMSTHGGDYISRGMVLLRLEQRWVAGFMTNSGLQEIERIGILDRKDDAREKLFIDHEPISRQELPKVIVDGFVEDMKFTRLGDDRALEHLKSGAAVMLHYRDGKGAVRRIPIPLDESSTAIARVQRHAGTNSDESEKWERAFAKFEFPDHYCTIDSFPSARELERRQNPNAVFQREVLDEIGDFRDCIDDTYWRNLEAIAQMIRRTGGSAEVHRDGEHALEYGLPRPFHEDVRALYRQAVQIYRDGDRKFRWAVREAKEIIEDGKRLAGERDERRTQSSGSNTRWYGGQQSGVPLEPPEPPIQRRNKVYMQDGWN